MIVVSDSDSGYGSERVPIAVLVPKTGPLADGKCD